MQFDKGYISPYFVTDQERMEAVLEEPYIALVNEDRQRPGAARSWRRCCQSGRPLLVVAEDVEGEALATLVVNKIRGHVQRRRGQGPGLRRSAQGHAAGHRDPDRRRGHQRGGRPEARERRARAARGARKIVGRRTTRRSSRAGAPRTRSRAGSTRSRPRSRRPTPTGIARSSRSASPSWRGVAVVKVEPPPRSS